jgi:hypothetical protein
MPPAKIFGPAALRFYEAAIFKNETAQGLLIASELHGPKFLCVHFGKKLEVKGVKASLANAL